jgi:tetratricopeptide (TPR) repeat protein
MRVAVYSIALNEARHVRRFMKSVSEADLVIVGDTGSIDETPELLVDLGAEVHRLEIDPWRFDVARNSLLSKLPHAIDVCVAIDLDDVFEPGWRDKLEAEWGDASRGRYLYTWSHLPDGSPGHTYWYDRIHSRSGYRWRHPCHEILYSDDDERYVELSLRLHHWPDPAKSRASYLPLLELARAETPENPRMSHYLGREYMFHQRWDDAISELERHLSLQESTWSAERGASMRFLGRCHWQLGDQAEAVKCWRRACAEVPETREPWIELAQASHYLRRWPECYAAATTALDITERPNSYITEPESWGPLPYDLASISAWHIGLKEEALNYAREALRLGPADQRIRVNVKLMEQELSGRVRRPTPASPSLSPFRLLGPNRHLDGVSGKSKAFAQSAFEETKPRLRDRRVTE